ncbi:receptor-like protein 12 [Olea europaea var. sylvestris]|uniref:Receptor 12 n=1 Tax=Olea europaea subsp. europaea TaxID=158383 RepID=A0A8S0QMA6_OLEEU|nr:receptor-like protein 12 [Olea europaea var. sylvestris]CAA2966778.1 receptor 12 [Olea europaea subsp. europaea]
MRILFSPLFFLISVFFSFGNPNLAPVHSQFLEDQKVLLHKMKDDFKLNSSLTTKLVSGQCLDDQRSLLIQFKNSIIFDPTLSVKLVTWNRSEDCCTWKGIACDSSGHVISLELDQESISGGIENSTSLLGFQYLEKLNLAYNRLYDIQIPKGIYNLANLTYLNLSNAGFVGQIPIEVSRMTRLVTLDLSTFRHLSQPKKLENPNLKTLVQNLKELRELYLDGVNISAPGSEWCQALSSSLPNLSYLSLSSCLLSGPLDSSLSQLQNLSFLRLDYNNLSTTIPDSFANFSKLTKLSMRYCFLQGFFPNKIFQLPTLQNLNLRNNNLLNGNLPQFPRGGSLRKIILGYTNFSGSLPDSIGNLGMLSWIDLMDCNFSGLLPPTITNLTEVVYLDFSGNKLTGLLPLFNMSKKLTHIDLSGNGLTGSLSSMHFEGLNDLVILDLSYNSLNGSIPPALFALPSLQKLNLSNNQFGGQVNEPSNTSSSQLDTLDLSSNLLEGPIPKFFFELRELKILSLDSNFFNGTVQMDHNRLSVNASISSSSSYPFAQLEMLILASCNLKSFPDLRNQSTLYFIDLSDNQIMGEIPNWIWEVGNGSIALLNLSHNLLQDLQKPYIIPSFIILDIHNNQLRGDLPILPSSAMYIDFSSNNFNHYIPADIGKNVSEASFFSLSNNNLMGAIPESICNSSYLRILDLSNNFLSGTIPKCLLSSQTLGVLNLGRNNLSGTIPDAFSRRCGLRTLDLSRNSLTGKIPGSLSHCKLLEVLNVGNNKVEGIFPCMLKNSSSLRVLVLRSNRFHGELQCPGTNNSWPNLQIIDIAFNNFRGYLSPRFFLGWRGMMLDNDVLLTCNLLTIDFNLFNHLTFDFNLLTFYFTDGLDVYYQVTVTVTIKGLELKLVKIPTAFTTIDLSSNNFRGEIPDTVGDLCSLYALNLSHNALIGQIPKSMGKLAQLESLDLSKNQLNGEIPKELTSLTFLSLLNLSYNKLVGSIPPGRQFQTYSSASFEGNTGLCGFPLNISCGGISPPSFEDKQLYNLKTNKINWDYVSAALGYSVGFVLTVWLLWLVL